MLCTLARKSLRPKRLGVEVSAGLQDLRALLGRIATPTRGSGR
jgi:hypothetical protein